MSAIQPYLDQYLKLASERKGEPAWLRAKRENAASALSRKGFPTPRDEEWRYTNVEPIVKTVWLPSASTTELKMALPFPAHAVFVNGRISDGLSLPPNVEYGRTPDWAEPYFAGSPVDAHPFAAMNTFLFSDALFIRIPRGQKVAEPIHIAFMSKPNGNALLSLPRIFVLAEDSSEVTIVESFVGASPAAYFTNGVTELVVGENAIVRHCRIEEESEAAFHVHRLDVRQERNSRLSSHVLSWGGALVRNEIHANLGAEGATCELDGLFILHGAQHADHHTCIDHAKPHGSSRELYKGILDGRSRGVFDGKIIVREGAQKTDAHQTNRNLILSDDALMDTKPQLEIFANDVKCTHGATVGRLNEEAIFYLRSRGISIEDARGMLTYAFGSAVLENLAVPAVRKHAERILLARAARPAIGATA